MTEAIRRAIQQALSGLRLPFDAFVKSSSASLLYILKQGLSRNDRADIEALQHYGLVSRLPEGTRVIVVPRMGATEKLVIVSEAHQTALSLSEGDVALERSTGEHVWLKGGAIEVKAAGGTVTVECATATVNATAVNLGGAGGKALVTEDLLLLFNLHIHGGVQGGSGTTAPPATPAVLQKTIQTKAL